MKTLHFTFNAIGTHLRVYTSGSGSGSTVEHETLTANATTDIVVGSILTDAAIIVNYTALRGSDHQMGTVMILNKGGASTEEIVDWFDTDIGLSFDSSINGNDIELNCTVDNSSVDDVELDYILELITL